MLTITFIVIIIIIVILSSSSLIITMPKARFGSAAHWTRSDPCLVVSHPQRGKRAGTVHP